MTTTHDAASNADFDLDFHFDPMCPFAWMTSRWIARVVELEKIRVNWRFISLAILNEQQTGDWYDEAYRHSHLTGTRYLRVCAAVRAAEGNGRIFDLYTVWGDRLWYSVALKGSGSERMAALDAIDFAELLSGIGVDEKYAAEADNEEWDAVLRSETAEALSRTGDDVGTPILTYWPSGNALFGPVISSVPDDETSVKMYEAVRTLVDFETFSEIKRSKRPPLDLPIFN